jgi:hypothetical protein
MDTGNNANFEIKVPADEMLHAIDSLQQTQDRFYRLILARGDGIDPEFKTQLVDVLQEIDDAREWLAGCYREWLGPEE